MKNAFAAALLTIVLAVPAVAKEGGCLALATMSEQTTGTEAVYSATGILDIDVWVLFHPGTVKKFAGRHTLEVRFFTPGGFLYQSVAIPFTESASMKGKKEKLEGYPHPMDVAVLVPITWAKGKYYGTSVRLPVAGSLIVSNGLYGKWTAEAYIDGEESRCAVPVSFTINP